MPINSVLSHLEQMWLDYQGETRGKYVQLMFDLIPLRGIEFLQMKAESINEMWGLMMKEIMFDSCQGREHSRCVYRNLGDSIWLKFL